MGRGTVACAALLLAVACGRRPEALQVAGPAMGTTYSVSRSATARRRAERVGRKRDRGRAARDGACTCRAGTCRANSRDSTRMPARTGSPMSPVLLRVGARRQLAVSRATGGAFDVTVGPLVRAWGFGAGAADGSCGADRSRRIAELLARRRPREARAARAPPALRKTSARLALDLDGIAPGWAVDRIAGRLEALGMHDYLVELGGEVRARGLSCRRTAVARCGRRPATGERRPLAVIELDDVGVSTSGDYRDYRVVNGRRILAHHRPAHGRSGRARAGRPSPWSTRSVAAGRRVVDGADGARCGGRHGARATAGSWRRCSSSGVPRRAHSSSRKRREFEPATPAGGCEAMIRA
ncbi:MAG: FAD:protein FMN transferase [Chromatiales bacterium]|nr:FAD:protein FMN transferase [Chromatiales bacterium]